MSNFRAQKRMGLGLPNDPDVFTSAVTLDMSYHERLIIVSSTSSTTITLPRSTGSGLLLNIAIGVNSATNTVIISRGLAADRMQGTIFLTLHNSTSSKPFQASQTTNANTITYNGSTTGGANEGDITTLWDAKAGTWYVSGNIIGTGGLATPFSNT